MNIISRQLTILLITLSQITPVLAALEFTNNANSFGRTENISGPADSMEYGRVFHNSGSQVHRICNSSAANYTLRNIVYEPIAIWTGRTHQATSAHVPIPLFEANVTGLAITPMGGNTDAGSPANFSPLYTEPTTVWTGVRLNDNRIANGHRVTAGVYVYKNEQRLTDFTVVPEQPFYRYLCQDDNGITQEIYTFIFRALTIRGTVTGCTPAESALVVEMDKIAQSTIENADPSTLIATQQRTFSLLCDPNINVSVSVVDLTDQTNYTTTAKLTPDSTATGVGFAISGSSGQKLLFGADGSAAQMPNQQKYFIQNSGTAYNNRNNPVSLRLGFSYVRKPEEEIKPGSAKAIVGITYSYQ